MLAIFPEYIEFSNRGRTRGDDFGLPGRPELLELAHTYLETQARLWPDSVGSAAVPAISAAALTAMAEGFERRFRQQAIAIFQPGPALAVLDCGGSTEADGSSQEPWSVVCQVQPSSEAHRMQPTEVLVPLNRKCHWTNRMSPVTPLDDSQPPQT